MSLVYGCMRSALLTFGLSFSSVSGCFVWGFSRLMSSFMSCICASGLLLRNVLSTHSFSSTSRLHVLYVRLPPGVSAW